MTTPTAAGRALAALRPRGPRTCEVCGAAFTGTSRARYCGNTCAQRAVRRKAKKEGKP